MVKINHQEQAETIKFIKNKWSQFEPDNLFTYQFVEEKIENIYLEERRIEDIFRYASLLAILIASLGLFVLVLISAKKRTREIGIQKTLSASVQNIILLLLKEYFFILVISNIVALPIAYFITSKWLQNFAYKINLGIEIFILSTIIVFVIALLTLSYNSIKASLANPVESLKYE